MSGFRQIAQIAGTVIGAYVGGVQGAYYGYQIGSLVGNIVDPIIVKSSGPRLSDSQVQYSSYGTTTPKIYAKYRAAGNVMWMSPIREISHKNKSSGKGGPKQVTTTYTYLVDIAVRICEGPIVGVPRMWADQKLVFDIRDGGDINAIVKSGKIAETVTLYLGDEEQLPDPTIEAAEGVGEVPAFRGKAYIVFTGWDVTATGGRLPNISFEVAASGSGGDPTILVEEEIDGAGTLLRIVAAGAEVTIVPESPMSSPSLIALDGSTRIPIARDAQWTGESFPSHTAGSLNLVVSPKGLPPWYVYYHYSQSGTFSIPPAYGIYDALTQSWSLGAEINDLIDWVGPTDELLIAVPDAAQKHVLLVAMTIGAPSVLGHGRWALVRVTSSGFDIVREGTVPSGLDSQAAQMSGWGSQSGVGANYYCGMLEENLSFFWTFQTAGNPGFRCWDISDSLMKFVFYKQPVNVSSFGNVTIFAQAGVAYAVDNAQYYSVATRLTSINGSDEPLSDVLTDISVAAGADISICDYDSVDDIDVAGYCRSVQTSARSCIEQLQHIYAFDLVPIDEKLVAVKRGGAPVATITQDELGASMERESTIAAVATTRGNEGELPQRIDLQYASMTNDYQPDSQGSERRVTTSTQKVSNSIPIVLAGNDAKQITEREIYNAWLSRNRRRIQVPRKYEWLTPTDIINVVTDEATFRLRIVSMTVDQGVVQLDCVDDEPAVYTQIGVGAPTSDGQILEPLPPSTILVTADLPTLRDDDTDWNFYGGAAGVSAGWTGANLYRSRDGGNSFVADSSINVEATLGITTSALVAAGTVCTTDPSSYVDVSVISGLFESVSHADMLDGANLIAIGSEVCQFRDAIDLGDGRVRLTPIIRGLYGTDFWAKQTALAGPPDAYRVGKGWYPQRSGVDAPGHYAGEQVILLDEGTVIRLNATATDSRTSFIERAVTFNAPADSGRDITHRHRGKGRLPFPPSVLHGYKSSGDIVLSWHRRGRIDTGWRSGADVPLDVVSERYWIQLNNGPVVATTTQTTTITSATLASLGISGAITWRVAQIPDDGDSAIDVYALDPEVWSPSMTIPA